MNLGDLWRALFHFQLIASRHLSYDLVGALTVSVAGLSSYIIKSGQRGDTKQNLQTHYQSMDFENVIILPSLRFSTFCVIE